MKIFENIVLLIGLITCLSGAWMRRSESLPSRGTTLFWVGFALMLFGLFVHSEYGQGFFTGLIEGWNPKP